MNAAETLLSMGKDEAFALIYGDDALTYAQLRDRVVRTASRQRAGRLGNHDNTGRAV